MLIAGCGYVGESLARRLTVAGHRVWGLRRRPHPVGEGIHTIVADLLDSEALGLAIGDLPELDTVFYTTAADGRDEAAYRAAYVQGLETLLRVLEEQERVPRRLLYTSSTSVYGQQAGEWVDEDSPTEPEHFTGRILLEGEALLVRAPFPTTVVRFGGIYGPGRTRLIEQVRRGAARIPASPLYTNRIHRDDCAGVLHHLMELPQAADLYLGVDDDPAEYGAVLRRLAERLGKPEPPEATEEEPRGDRSRGAGKRCRNLRLRQSGYIFQYPTFREGYTALL
jgi:nucleoside-diphosphate-sugar epimerase